MRLRINLAESPLDGVGNAERAQALFERIRGNNHFFSVFITVPYPARLNTPNISAEIAAMVNPTSVSYGNSFSRSCTAILTLPPVAWKKLPCGR